jgi:hypothetical protein
MGGRAVGGDAVEPGGELGVTPEPTDRSERSQVGLLHDLPGIVVVGDQATGQGEGVGVRSAHKFGEGQLISTPGCVDQCVDRR